MKFDKDILTKCYHDAAILQYERELKKQGFSVHKEYEFYEFQADLYAEKASEKRVYEFKLIGNNAYAKGNITKFKKFVEEHNAIPYVVYINPPVEKQINFDELAELVNDYLISGELPSELDRLSTHTSIDTIEIDDVIYIDISDSIVRIEGFATVFVDLQYGSNSDMCHGDGISDSDSFPMSFDVELEYDDKYSIRELKYEIDTSDFYE